MKIYRISFFGHRRINNLRKAEEKLYRLLCDIIRQNEYVEFLIGRDGDFDLFAAAVIKRAISCCGYGNTSMILVLPYIKAEYRANEQQYLKYYDEIEICHEAAIAHFKAAIQIRNRSMVNRSDMVICYIDHKSGGAYKTVQYAKKINLPIINLSNL